jgi:hypothetical protein
MYDLIKGLFNTQSMKVTIILTFAVCYGWAQSTAGDIAFIAANADGGDDFAFVALVDISASANIYFTDNEWNGTAFTDINEGELTWTNAASTLSAGSVVVFTDPASGGTVNVGSLSGTGWNLGASNEWWYALLEAPATSYGSPPTFLAAMANDAGAGWLTGTGLTDGTHAVDFNDDNDGYEYTGARTGQSSFSDYLTIIYNTSNWQIETADGELILPISTTAFSVSGGGVDNPTSLSASVQSSSQIDLSWTDNTDGDNVLLAWSSTETFGTPTNGQTYSADDAISGGGTVLQYSGTDSDSHTSLTGNTHYYYKAWSYDGSTYSSGATTDATTLKIESTNHPTSFSASSSYQSIEITWTDAATGSQAPDGYLILGETDATITDPSDGTAVSDDTDATGNAVAKNITHGSGGSYTFNSLTASTTWYFEIFSYTNSGSDIDYKLDGTIQTANATTGVAPVFVINEILADPDATNGDANGDGIVSTTDDEFVEIVNRSGYSVDISNWVISDGYSDRHTVTDGTTIGDGVALVVFSGGTPTGISGIVHTASTGALGLNNTSDDVTLKDSEGGTIVTYSYGSTAGDNQSIARNPDYTGDFVKHSTISGNPVLFSPGKTNAGDVSLPVDLSYFTANSTRSDEITLTWVTESEFENLGFLVERRNVDVESSWNEIASYINYSELQGQGSVSHRTEYTFTDNTVEMEQTYDYRLADVSFQGVKEYHEIHVLDVSPITTPSKFLLLQNYPNPFNPTTTIGYDLPQQSAVKLTIHNVQGRQIASIQDEQKPAGSYQVLWNGMNQVGNQVSTGVYFARLQAGDFNQTIKMVYMK